MMKSCAWCGRIHPEGFVCPHKPKRLRQADESKQSKFRESMAWRRAAKRVLARDSYLCQACLHELPGTVRKYNSTQLSVHHITPLAEDFRRRLDDDNLITLCPSHHAQAERGQIAREKLYELARRA